MELVEPVTLDLPWQQDAIHCYKALIAFLGKGPTPTLPKKVSYSQREMIVSIILNQSTFYRIL